MSTSLQIFTQYFSDSLGNPERRLQNVLSDIASFRKYEDVQHIARITIQCFPLFFTSELKEAHASATCFRRRSNMRMKQFRFISSSSQSKSIVLPPGCPKFLKGLRNGLRIGLRNGLWKGLWNGLSIFCWTRRPGSEATLT